MFTIKVNNEREARAMWRACYHEMRCRRSANPEYWYKDEEYKDRDLNDKYLIGTMRELESNFNIGLGWEVWHGDNI